MKNIVIKYMSALLAVWYCLSIIGFDVHSCEATGESFLASTISGITCEDIHPEHSCHDHGHCCHHGHGSSCTHGEEVADDSRCCTDDIHILAVQGIASDDSQRHSCKWTSGYSPCIVHHAASVVSLSCGFCSAIDLHLPDSGCLLPDRQALLRVWRI